MTKKDSMLKTAMDKCPSWYGDYKCHVKTNVVDSKGRSVSVDKCLKELIELLNANGFKTVASCCGHGDSQPIISIEIDEGDWKLVTDNQPGDEFVLGYNKHAGQEVTRRANHSFEDVTHFKPLGVDPNDPKEECGINKDWDEYGIRNGGITDDDCVNYTPINDEPTYDEVEILDCPKCGRTYDDADADFLICHICGHNADTTDEPKGDDIYFYCSDHGI
jgi:hypothetical protein